MTLSLLLVAITALGLLGTLALFVSLKHDVETRARRESERVDAMLARLVEAETRIAPPSPPAFEPELVSPRSGLNLSKRVQVIRMLRQGEDTGQIAAALGLSRAEVQILASVHTVAGGLSKSAGAQ
jgi:DNA-binding NarL/FixJ family response regulator